MKYDKIVIGAGSAGAVLASRLSEDPDCSVLLLEAGPDYPDFETLPFDLKHGWGTGPDIVVGGIHDWQFTGTASTLSKTMPIPRGKVTGGTSAINGQVFLRPLPEDFERWVEWGNDRWSFKECLPYLLKIETDLDYDGDFHGQDGPILVKRHPLNSLTDDQLAFYKACKYLGYEENIDHNLPDATGVGPYPLNNPDGIRFSTALGYLSQSRHRLNLTIKPNCVAQKIVFDRNVATGVEVISGGEIFKVEGTEVILSAGSIATPQILMLSGIGSEKLLSPFHISVVSDLPGVGKNLRDHPTVHTTWTPHSSFNKPEQKIGPQKVALRYTSQDSKYQNDMIMIMRFSHEIGDVGALMISVGIYLAESVGRISLQSTDIHTQPILDYNLLGHKYDLKRLREGVRLADKIAKAPSFTDTIVARLSPDEITINNDDLLDRWMLENVLTMHHISGTCKMGPKSDAEAVVDQYGVVYGTEQLRIADASILPDCPRANTNVAAMLIGERIADFIKTGD